VVYKLDASGHETVLYSFTGGADGGTPVAGVIRDSAGNLYGTTEYGGNVNCIDTMGCGVVYKVDTSGHESVLHTFSGGDDGSFPYAGVILDSAGNLYGTTEQGGDESGVVYKLDPAGQETVLHAFCSLTGCTDGVQPVAGVILDSAGNLYGTTLSGGAGQYGVVYEMDTAGTLTVLYSFTNGADGGFPEAGVIRGPSGDLYGTATSGGKGGAGVVFKIVP
jgi:uncharacterized repeat protein (TIGR03803 family)